MSSLGWKTGVAGVLGVAALTALAFGQAPTYGERRNNAPAAANVPSERNMYANGSRSTGVPSGPTAVVPPSVYGPPYYAGAESWNQAREAFGRDYPGLPGSARPGGWNRWWYYGRWWPWYGTGGWPGYYGNNAYTYPYNYSYGYSYPNDLAYVTDQRPLVNDYSVPGQADLPVVPQAVQQPITEPTSVASQYYAAAVGAFRSGNFSDSVRLAGHAAMDDPKSPGVHLLLSLGLFAMGEYRPAAAEAHAVTALGETPDWPTVYQFYGDPDTYTDQLRALERFVREHPDSAEGRFLLGFQYMITGYRDAANAQFMLALRVTPQDRIAADLLRREGGQIPADVATRLARRPTEQVGGMIIGRPSPNLGNMARNLPGPPSPIR